MRAFPDDRKSIVADIVLYSAVSKYYLVHDRFCSRNYFVGVAPRVTRDSVGNVFNFIIAKRFDNLQFATPRKESATENIAKTRRPSAIATSTSSIERMSKAECMLEDFFIKIHQF